MQTLGGLDFNLESAKILKGVNALGFLSALSEWFQGVAFDFNQAFFEADRYLLYLEGLQVTIKVTIAAIIFGTILGILLALMKISSVKILRFISIVYIDFIRGTPTVVQLLIAYMLIFTSPSASKTMVAIFAFGCNSAAYIAEIIRSGINSIDKGQHEAGRSLGLSKSRTMAYIIMPQAIRNILPTYANEFIVLVKETAIVGYIGLADLTKISSIITSRTYEAFFPLIIIALIYLAITTILSKLFAAMERKLNEHDKR